MPRTTEDIHQRVVKAISFRKPVSQSEWPGYTDPGGHDHERP